MPLEFRIRMSPDDQAGGGRRLPQIDVSQLQPSKEALKKLHEAELQLPYTAYKVPKKIKDLPHGTHITISAQEYPAHEVSTNSRDVNFHISVWVSKGTYTVVGRVSDKHRIKFRTVNPDDSRAKIGMTDNIFIIKSDSREFAFYDPDYD